MPVSVILAHPRADSFNHAIAAACLEVLEENGHSVNFHDLYCEGFDPVLPPRELERGAPLPTGISKHCGEIAEASGIVIVHPNWWGQPPAILKGWVDRVLRPGVAYEFLEGDSGEGVPRGMLRARSAMVFNTSNTHEEREERVFGDPLGRIWEACIFGLCGIDDVYRRTFGVVVTSTDQQRRQWLEEVAVEAGRRFPAG